MTWTGLPPIGVRSRNHQKKSQGYFYGAGRCERKRWQRRYFLGKYCLKLLDLTDLEIWSKRILPFLDGFGQNELMDEPLFLKVRPGDAVLYEKDQIGKVLTFVGGSRDPDAPSLFQIANVDSGEIRWIHGEEVTDIVSEYRTTIKKPSTFYEQIQQQQQ